MKRRRDRTKRLLIGAGALFLFLGSLWFFWPRDWTPEVDRAEAAVVGLLKAQGVVPGRDLLGEAIEPRRQGGWSWTFKEQRYRVPADFAWEGFRKSLPGALKKRSLGLLKTGRERKAGSWVFQVVVGRGSVSLYRLVLEKSTAVSAAPALHFPHGQGKIAIVLDDWGYSLHQVPVLSAIRSPLTVAILPGLPYSTEVAKAAHAQGHEVILHLPMESRDPHEPREKETITTSLGPPKILARFNQAVESIPFAQGVSNHQGSKATSDEALMEMVLGEAKRRRLYFLDSLTTDGSVCKQVAQRLRLRFAQRNVFIDNENSPEAIYQRVAQLATIASRRGVAVGIGHDRPATLQFLQQAIPALESAGYTLVPTSEVARAE